MIRAVDIALADAPDAHRKIRTAVKPVRGDLTPSARVQWIGWLLKMERERPDLTPTLRTLAVAVVACPGRYPS
jgi:hypothetical protein